MDSMLFNCYSILEAHHAEEQMYVLSPTVLGEHYRMLDADEKVRKNMCQLWVNFLTAGYVGVVQCSYYINLSIWMGKNNSISQNRLIFRSAILPVKT